VSISLRGQGMK